MVKVPSGASTVTWSILDTGGSGTAGTIVCVHGNPTWGYIWRDLLCDLGDRWRVIAVDQTGMGWSERAGKRLLAQRIDELVAFCAQEVSGPLVLAAHDWGGPVAMGAAAQLDVRAVVLTNTAVAKPEGVRVPPLIALARSAINLTCERTSLFVKGTARMTDRQHRNALEAPYRTAARRSAVADFVADIPVRAGDPSYETLKTVTESFGALEGRGIPVLLLWGGRDPVFHDRFLADLLSRAPHADVHRFGDAAHLVALDEPIGPIVGRWLDQQFTSDQVQVPAASMLIADWFTPITTAIIHRRHETTSAYVGPDGTRNWQQLHDNALRIAHRLVTAGVQPGDRIAVLVPPGAQLLEAAFGAWLAGAVIVVADSALGPTGLRHAFRSAEVNYLLGTPRTVLAAKALRFAPDASALSLGRLFGAINLHSDLSVHTPVDLPTLANDSLAAVVHTSGATGTAKPVRYTHGALAAQRDVVRAAFELDDQHGFVSSFAPFILLGPALGVPCVLPTGDILSPAELDFDTFAEACRRSGADVAWLSPASARTIVRTANGRRMPLRLVMLAGAPIPAQLAEQIREVTGADVRAPYGMTELMPLTDGRGAAAQLPVGTSTGRPLPGATVVITPFGRPDAVSLPAGEWGEILANASWMRAGYDRRWGTDSDSTIERGPLRFHRSGDVGLLDHQGNLIQLGRSQHVITTASGPLPCVVIEQPLADLFGRGVAAVGIGPSGAQVIAVVLEAAGDLRLADIELTTRVRAGTETAVAAVLEGALPVDIRHQSKVRRDLLAIEATKLLEGR
jgi:acyl-coenzyme A synthetase/AMP-(fatty) acid ligase/pimeloyl-ACP methyl ester carboxylesterase